MSLPRLPGEFHDHIKVTASSLTSLRVESELREVPLLQGAALDEYLSIHTCVKDPLVRNMATLMLITSDSEEERGDALIYIEHIRAYIAPGIRGIETCLGIRG